MKLPFELSLSLLFRLLLPGAVLAALLYPLASPFKLKSGLFSHSETLFVGLGLGAGLALLLLEMPIYMLFLGRRWWPGVLRRHGLRREQGRLEQLLAQAKDKKNEARKIELDLEAAQFPLDPATGEPVARYPTRLGNLMASFETYPNVKYGIDGVFFWPRLMVSVDKDLRAELDNAQALVDGAIYACLAFAIAAPTCLAYHFFLPAERVGTWLVLSAGSLVLSVVCYRAAVLRYGQFGALFAATFDQHRHLLNFGTLVADLDAHMQVKRHPPRTERDTARAVWRFLRWHRYRPPGGSNVIVTNWIPPTPVPAPSPAPTLGSLVTEILCLLLKRLREGAGRGSA